MKVPFKQRTWIGNLGLVFWICLANFVPLLAVMFVCSLPYLFFYLAGTIGAVNRYSMSWLLGPSLDSDWSLLGLFVRPLRQAFCLYIVARCYEGVRMPVVGGLRHCLRSLPALIAYTLVTTIGLILIVIPGSFIGFATMSPFIFFVASGIPFLYMYSGWLLGPAIVIVEGKGPISAMGHSFALSRKRKLYLFSFMGVLFLPTFIASMLSWNQPPMSSFDPMRGRFIPEPGWSLTLRGIIAMVLDMPATIGPAILYFQCKARGHRVPAAQLAAFVDQIGERHDDEGD